MSRLSVDRDGCLTRSHTFAGERNHTLTACRPDDDEGSSIQKAPMVRLIRFWVLGIMMINPPALTLRIISGGPVSMRQGLGLESI
jgi:hypothetical protein